MRLTWSYAELTLLVAKNATASKVRAYVEVTRLVWQTVLLNELFRHLDVGGGQEVSQTAVVAQQKTRVTVVCR